MGTFTASSLTTRGLLFDLASFAGGGGAAVLGIFLSTEASLVAPESRLASTWIEKSRATEANRALEVKKDMASNGRPISSGSKSNTTCVCCNDDGSLHHILNCVSYLFVWCLESDDARESRERRKEDSIELRQNVQQRIVDHFGLLHCTIRAYKEHASCHTAMTSDSVCASSDAVSCWSTGNVFSITASLGCRPICLFAVPGFDDNGLDAADAAGTWTFLVTSVGTSMASRSTLIKASLYSSVMCFKSVDEQGSRETADVATPAAFPK